MLFVGLLLAVVGGVAILAGVRNLSVAGLFHGQFTKGK